MWVTIPTSHACMHTYRCCRRCITWIYIFAYLDLICYTQFKHVALILFGWQIALQLLFFLLQILFGDFFFFSFTSEHYFITINVRRKTRKKNEPIRIAINLNATNNNCDTVAKVGLTMYGFFFSLNIQEIEMGSEKQKKNERQCFLVFCNVLFINFTWLV